MTWRFGKTDISWNYRSEYLSAEETSQVSGNLARERGALVIHGEQKTFNGERGIQRAANAHQRVHQFGNAFERVIFALDRNKNGVACDQRVERKKVQRRRAINDNILVIFFYST